MLTIKQLYDKIYKEFVLRNFEIPYIETELLLEKTLGLDKTFLYTYPDKKLTKNQINKVLKNLALRLKNIPLAYIFNETEFFGLKFYINKNVLIPRQETELIVEECINLIEKYNLKICADIGTGSGNIVISILKKLKDKKVKFFVTDFFESALKVAKKNAKIHKVEKSIEFILTDKLEYFLINSLKLDLIVSNPPYVSVKEYRYLQKEIYFEPKEALLTKDGLEFYKYFSKYAKCVVKPGGFLVLEINSNLFDKIYRLFRNKILKIIYDYQSLPRGFVIRY